jgi:hypothetical protein
MADYIPTFDAPVTIPAVTILLETSKVLPPINFSTGFANKIVAGNSCSISSTTGFVSNIQNSVSYSVNCSRTPVYHLGSQDANSFFLDKVEKQMDISSTDLASFINYSGAKLPTDLSLVLKDPQNNIVSSLLMNSGSNIYLQKYSTQEGDALITQVSIKEIVV